MQYGTFLLKCVFNIEGIFIFCGNFYKNLEITTNNIGTAINQNGRINFVLHYIQTVANPSSKVINNQSYIFIYIQTNNSALYLHFKNLSIYYIYII